MKTLRFAALLAASLMVANSGYAYITYLGKSLPNQAGVNYDYLLDQWDFATLPVFYGAAKADTLTAFYSADGNGNNGYFKLAGRNTLGGFPLFWGVSVRNNGTETNDFKTPNGASDWKLTQYNSDTAVQVGTLLGGIGFNVFARLNNINNEEATNSNNGAAFTAKGDSYLDTRNTYNAFGLNVGQGNETLTFFWSVGVEYVQRGGTLETKTAGVKVINQPFDGNTLPESNEIRLSTRGRLPLGSDSLLAGWRASFATSSGSSEHKAGTTKLSSQDYSAMALEDLALYLTQVLPVSDKSRFLISEELGFAYSSSTLSGKPQDNTIGDGGTILTAGVKSAESKDSSYNVYLALPLIFQVTVTEGLLVNAGWYPTLNLLQQDETTQTVAAATKQENKTTTTYGYRGSGNNFGLGLSYLPSQNLRVHLNATNIGGAAASGVVTFGADYIF